jgi:circadian clock protein KaiB
MTRPAPDTRTCDLTLFVSGASDLSARAIADTRRLCDLYLAGRHHLTVVDIHDDPEAVARFGVFAAPTLVRRQPLPLRRIVGDLSDADHVLQSLQLLYAEDGPAVLDEKLPCPDPPLL